MLERKEPLSNKPRVKLSTIHAAKGGEADNVLLVLDMSKRTLESLQRSIEKQDEEHRVWYVGVTRAKQNLYFIAGKNKERSNSIRRRRRQNYIYGEIDSVSHTYAYVYMYI